MFVMRIWLFYRKCAIKNIKNIIIVIIIIIIIIMAGFVLKPWVVFLSFHLF